MAVGNPAAVTSHGLFTSGSSGPCDYPSEDDVRAGVVYANGLMTGNLELPSEPDVLFGIGYGSNATEFTGSLTVPTPPTPVPPVFGMSPFAAIGTAIIQRLALITNTPDAYIVPVATDRYKVAVEEPFFLYCQFFGITSPRDPGLNFVNSGAGRRSMPVARRLRVYVYTRSGVDVYGTDSVALFGQNPSQGFDTPPTYPGQFVAEEVVLSALVNWTPLYTPTGSPTQKPLTITPLHPMDASEQPQRKPEDEDGLIRSCLDFEIVYLLNIDPTEPIT